MAFLVSFLVTVQHLRAASDVTVSTAATSNGSFSGGNPNVFTPTASHHLHPDGKNVQTEDEDIIGLPDAGELQ